MADGPQHQGTEIELKAIQYNFDRFPPDLLVAMATRQNHPDILQRGPVEQVYLRVNAMLIATLCNEFNRARIPFGSFAEQHAMRVGGAREVRVLRKTVQGVVQVTVKGAHRERGMVVSQLETPEEYSEEVGDIVAYLNLDNHTRGRVVKMWHDLRMPIAGIPFTIEHDIIVSHGGLMVVEVEMHNTGMMSSVEQLVFWQESGLLPPCFQEFVTARNDLKSRSLAINNLPPNMTIKLLLRKPGTKAWIKRILTANGFRSFNVL